MSAWGSRPTDPAGGLAAYFQGTDLDKEGDAVQEDREQRVQKQFSMRSAGLIEGLQASPLRTDAEAPPQCGRAGRLASWSTPLVVAPTRSGDRTQNDSVVLSGSSSTCSSDSIAVGFGRHTPYSEVAAVMGGGWLSSSRSSGGLRVALRRAALAGACPQAVANTVAESPGIYSYVLQGDTYVPAGLAPGDRYLPRHHWRAPVSARSRNEIGRAPENRPRLVYDELRLRLFRRRAGPPRAGGSRGALRVVDRILTGDWGLHPQCAPASRGAAAGE